MNEKHMSPEAIEELFNGLAVGSGRSRDDFEADVDRLRALAAADDHLTFAEADNIHGLTDARKAHADTCEYCKRLIDTFYLNDINVAAFEQRVRQEIAARKPRVHSSYAGAAVGALLGLVIVLLPRLTQVNTTANSAQASHRPMAQTAPSPPVPAQVASAPIVAVPAPPTAFPAALGPCGPSDSPKRLQLTAGSSATPSRPSRTLDTLAPYAPTTSEKRVGGGTEAIVFTGATQPPVDTPSTNGFTVSEHGTHTVSLIAPVGMDWCTFTATVNAGKPNVWVLDDGTCNLNAPGTPLTAEQRRLLGRQYLAYSRILLAPDTRTTSEASGPQRVSTKQP